jgi:hypothetical protein
MYSHLPYFLYIAAMFCYSEDEEFFYVCEPPVFCLWYSVLFRCVGLLVL